MTYSWLRANQVYRKGGADALKDEVKKHSLPVLQGALNDVGHGDSGTEQYRIICDEIEARKTAADTRENCISTVWQWFFAFGAVLFGFWL